MKEVSADTLAGWFITFAQLANHSLSPTQTKMATQRAGEVLDAIGIEEFKVGHTVFKALKPEGKEIELEAAVKTQIQTVE